MQYYYIYKLYSRLYCALVLAHSLRDAHTTKQLAVLVTLDTVSAASVTQLKTVYDHVIPVPRIQNAHPANLHLMNRGDLHSAFTKINLWKQLEFSKIVYIDADVVAYRAPDELFAIEDPFAAAPDIGWPDLFNTGVMVLTPNMGDYYAMMAMADRGISFDGADQGLLNMHFRNDHRRISFAYNVTPSAHYQYIPAFRHFQSSINMVHFIGPDKPWFSGRHAPHGNSPFDEMVGRWWAVYDRHYRKVHEAIPLSIRHRLTDHATYRNPRQQCREGITHRLPAPTSTQDITLQAALFASERGLAGVGKPELEEHASEPSAPSIPPRQYTHTEHRAEQHHAEHHAKSPPRAPVIMEETWDAQRRPPPAGSKPEAIDLPSAHYPMSRDVAPFVAPPRYPSPPKDMWYEVPKEPTTPAEPPKPMFPWENRRPPPTRTFAGQEEPSSSSAERSDPVSEQEHTASSDRSGKAPSTPTKETPKSPEPSVGPWSSFQLNNAWDQVPQIGRYVDSLQKHRRVRSLGPNAADVSSPQQGAAFPSGAPSLQHRRIGGFKLTDFPTEAERPSLPVTPAPIGRSYFWGQDDDHGDSGGGGERSLSGQGQRPSGFGAGMTVLPPAEGVPNQSDWDPELQLQKLAKQQHEHILRKLSGDSAAAQAGGREMAIPNREMPFGSEDARSPTYSSQMAPRSGASGAAATTAAAAGVTETTPFSPSMSSTTAASPAADAGAGAGAGAADTQGKAVQFGFTTEEHVAGERGRRVGNLYG
ncbi:glycogenin [Geosmithia morbida]|uniref:glycogenin glucosyltransferase n=1 Tax=Geosmithia morbida TaxID=1094350 RepID=A0A9P4YU93_9HYPO|nr:glycogenin [Geosmithia morbida]KAF4121798.1 glycogenin [Geosmithia morbida]